MNSWGPLLPKLQCPSLKLSWGIANCMQNECPSLEQGWGIANCMQKRNAPA